MATEVKLIALDPAHFHAALVQKEMLPGIAHRSYIYAPLGQDLFEHLKRIDGFNTRADHPTAWELDIHTTIDDPLRRMCTERPGNVVVIAGHSGNKMDRIRASLDAGLNVLADKPWIIHAAQLPALEAALDLADRTGLVAYDIMTERYEPTNIVQRNLVNDPAVFGTMVAGTDAAPGVTIQSVHHLLKLVAGQPNLRPAFFFDASDQGTALADVGTHLLDLVQWTLFPDQSIRTQDLRVGAIRRWPTEMTLEEFQRVTALPAFPARLDPIVKNGRLQFDGNGEVHYQIRGVHVNLSALWHYQSPNGIDLQHAVYRGSKAHVDVRQGEKEKYIPEVYVAPNGPADRAEVTQALEAHLRKEQATYAGIGYEAQGDELHITIPDKYRIGHEAHFGQVLSHFLSYLGSPKSMPGWEKADMIAKYTVSTTGV